jgi:hypothetical protein
MGELINFEEYLTAKQAGVSVHELRAARQVAEEMLAELTPEQLAGEYYDVDLDDEDWPLGYSFILKEDAVNPLHQNCGHETWKVIEKDYQIQCTSCKLNAWSAPW